MQTSQKLFILLFAICCTLVTWGILRAAPPQELFDNSDKVAHFLAFSALSFTGRLAFKETSACVFWPVMILLAFAMEYLQGQLQATRYASFEDAIANVVGVGIAFLVSAVLYYYKKTKHFIN